MFQFINVFLGHKLLHRELLVSWSNVVENPIIGPKLRPFSMHSFTKPLQYLYIINSVDFLASCHEFKVTIHFTSKKMVSIFFICNFEM